MVNQPHPDFQSSLDFAEELDRRDPLRDYRQQFHIPVGQDGKPVVYLCGHSLGLQPRGVRALVEEELDAWANLGVEGHFRGASPWYSYHEQLREPGARLVGATPGEVVFMNSLTVNLHLMLASFFRPARKRRCILIDEPAFPSDRYAVASHLQHRGLEPQETLLAVSARANEPHLRTEDIQEVLEHRGEEIAVVLLNGVNFHTGQVTNLERITTLAHQQGCLVGVDLAHAVGNVVLELHNWEVDFAVWCSYKYLNGGPGAVGGCFVHERHVQNRSLPRLAGWWGNDPETRFQMHAERTFVPRASADGWQLSNPPILAMAPLRASLTLFDRAGMLALREKSERLTAYLQYLLDTVSSRRWEMLTPRNVEQRGCQLSLRVGPEGRELVEQLQQEGVVCDFREPDVIRLAPVPLYNSHADVWTVAHALARRL